MGGYVDPITMVMGSVIEDRICLFIIYPLTLCIGHKEIRDMYLPNIEKLQKAINPLKLVNLEPVFHTKTRK